MSKVYDEYQRRMGMAMQLVNLSEVDPKAVAEVAIGSLAAAQISEEEFIVGLTGMVRVAINLQAKWRAEAEEAAEVECNCKACQLRKAAQGGPVVVEEASPEEAAELLAAFGEGS